MSHVDISTLRPMRDDIILRHKSFNETRTIFVKDSEDETHNMLFEVLRVGRDAKHIQVGQTVVVPWPRCVPPFEVLVDGKVVKVTITSETEVLGVMQHDD